MRRTFLDSHPGWFALIVALILCLGDSPAQAQLVGSGGSSGTLGGSYIDDARPQDVVRFRFDGTYNNTRPDRAEFIYPQYQRQLNEKGQP